MTPTTRRALYRVRNHARRLVQAIDALGRVDFSECDFNNRINTRVAREYVAVVADDLTRILDDGATAAEVASDGDDA